jgi:hypothetical protein
MQALSAADLADLGSITVDDTLANYDPDGYDLFTPTQFQTLYLRTSRIIPVPAPAPAPTLLSPRMTAVLAYTTDSSSSYFSSRGTVYSAVGCTPAFMVAMAGSIPTFSTCPFFRAGSALEREC